MRSSIAVLLFLPTLAVSQYSTRFSYSQGAPAYRWVQSSESVDLSVTYAADDQLHVGVSAAWQYLVLHDQKLQAIMTPVALTGRFYTSPSGLRGYADAYAGIVRRYYQYIFFSSDDPANPYAFTGVGSSIHFAPVYGIGMGVAVPVVPGLDLDLGIQLDASPKGFQGDNRATAAPDGFTQTRAVIGLAYSIR